ncbi:VanZ family protein [Echinicola jeungdonensis]|uniref:VanZ family protein n=1 Tax=Echinicola jeungdonensis TaxID=709343 RepID=A0ABV5J6W5_9BACT|nr:VanZ family protein [Echinicola jeungdonensis]MDN3668073.1 VanZ family protein [Echinicola jeungdonensis]
MQNSWENPDKVLGNLTVALLWLALLIWLILSPGENLPSAPDIPGLDKMVHFGLFAGLLFLWNRVWRYRQRKIKKVIFITNYLVFGIIFAILIEEVQRFIPDRSYDVGDIIANLLGSMIGTICFIILYKQRCRFV